MSTEPLHLPSKPLSDRVTDVLWPIMCLVPLFLVLLPSALFGEGPKPVAVASAGIIDWQTNPQAALQLVLADNQRLIQAFQELVEARKTDWWGYAVGAAGVGIAMLKIFNGPAGVLAEGLWAMVAPKLVKDAEKKRDVMADGFLQVASIMRSFPANTALGDVIDKLDRRLPEDVKRVYREWESNEANDRPALVAPAPLVTAI